MPLYPRLYSMAVSILGIGSDDAADAVQTAMVKIWKSGPAIAKIQNPAAYAAATLRTVSIDMLRRRRHDEPIDSAVGISDPQQCDPDTDDFLDWAISQLPPQQQRIVRLSISLSLSNEEIAQTTGLSPENVRQILSRGRRKIKKLYTKFMQ